MSVAATFLFRFRLQEKLLLLANNSDTVVLRIRYNAICILEGTVFMEHNNIQTPKRNLVTIKGSNEGLTFRLNDEEPFSLVAEELKHKVRRELSTLLTGPMVRIKIDCGRRELSDKQRRLLEEIISLKENLILTRINSSSPKGEATLESTDSASEQGISIEAGQSGQSIVHMIDEQNARIYRGVVRSGQELEHDGNLVILGDVHAGAKISATGDVIVMGKINGFVHAGSLGDRKRMIVACSWGNCQMKIAECVGKTHASDQKQNDICHTTAYLDEYRIQFKHKKLTIM